MAIIANTFTSFNAAGIRESLANTIAMISPEDTPFMSNIGSTKVSNTRFDWQTDALGAVVTTARIDGDDVAAFDATPATTRIGNYSQILRRTVIVADNLEFQDKAGRANELSYQLAHRGRELKRDIESVLLLNNAAAIGGAPNTPRQTAGLGAWVAANVSLSTGGGVNGANPANANGTAARTDGTQRAMTEPMVKAVMQSAYANGGKPSMLMVGAFNKGTVSGFAGIAAQRYMASGDSPTTIIGTADVYMSDFGTLNVVPNRFQRARDTWLIDPEYVSVANLRPIEQKVLAKTGDAEKRMVIWEGGLIVNTEAAHGLVADCTTA